MWFGLSTVVVAIFPSAEFCSCLLVLSACSGSISWLRTVESACGGLSGAAKRVVPFLCSFFEVFGSVAEGRFLGVRLR